MRPPGCRLSFTLHDSSLIGLVVGIDQTWPNITNVTEFSNTAAQRFTDVDTVIRKLFIYAGFSRLQPLDSGFRACKGRGWVGGRAVGLARPRAGLAARPAPAGGCARVPAAGGVAHGGSDTAAGDGAAARIAAAAAA